MHCRWFHGRGIALIGAVTATLASWIVEKISDQTVRADTATAAQVEQLRTELAGIRQMLQVVADEHCASSSTPDVAASGEHAPSP